MKVVGKVLYGIFASLVLGAGMCMVLEFEMLLLGIIVGVVGIVLLLLLIPMCIGLKDDEKEEIEEGAVEGFNKVSDKFVENFFTKEGETVEEAKERMKAATEKKEK